MQRACDSCGRDYEAKRPTRSKYCSDTCRVRGRRGARAPKQPKPAVAAVAPSTVGTPLTDSTSAELKEAGRTDTALGQAALAIARRVDAGGDTGAGLASLIKQLGVTLASAVEGANQAADPVDELRAWRDRKRAG